MKISGFEWDWKKKPLWTNNFLFSICCTYTIYIQGNLLCLSREMDPLYSFCDTYLVSVFLAWETSLRFSLFKLNLIYFQDPKQILLQVQKYQLPCVLISVNKLIEWCFWHSDALLHWHWRRTAWNPSRGRIFWNHGSSASWPTDLNWYHITGYYYTRP